MGELHVPSVDSSDIEAPESGRNDGGKFVAIASCKEELRAQSQMNEAEVHGEHGMTCAVPLFNAKEGDLDVGETDVEETCDLGEGGKCFGQRLSLP
ncbi:hypothetical protein H0H87_008485 [Tephrocybe sp. NHM501043]|nr:hypothetical protein H0H87_008485 [Tephrocybe sp. NHM501043]